MRRSRTTACAATAALFAAVLIAPPAAQADNWLQDGYNAVNTRNTSDGPLESRSANPTKVWQKSLDGGVTGTPVVSGSYVYAGTTNGVVYGLARDVGVTVWARYAVHPGGGPIIGSPLFHEGTLYVVVSKVGEPKLVALDALTGDFKWSTVLDTQRDADAWGSPNISVTKGLIYVGTCSCKAFSENRATAARGSVVAVQAATGAIAWKTPTITTGAGAGVAGSPLVIDAWDRLFVTTGPQTSGVTQPTSSAIVALDTATGAILGHYKPAPGATGGSGFTAGPNATLDDKRRLLVGAGSHDGHYHAVVPLTMAHAYSTQVGLGSRDGGVVSAASWDRTRVVGVTSSPSAYFGLNLNGSAAWLMPATDVTHRGPVSTARQVGWSTSSAGFVDTFDSKTGRILGRIPLGAPSVGGVSFANKRAFVGIGEPKSTSGGIASFK